MPKISVTSYNSAWPQFFKATATKLQQVLAEQCKEIHHIGSTAIPGMAAKPIIDIVAVVPSLIEAIEPIKSTGLTFRGENIIPLHLYFKQEYADYSVNLHVYEPDNTSIKLHLCFRDYLRQAPALVAQYSQLKYKLAGDLAKHQKQKVGLTGYNLGKDQFIQEVIRLTDFQGVYLRFCLHNKEWQQYRKIWQEYNNSHELNCDFTKSRTMHYHFVLYSGMEIIAIAAVAAKEKLIYVYGVDSARSKMHSLLVKWMELQPKLSGYIDEKAKSSSFMMAANCI